MTLGKLQLRNSIEIKLHAHMENDTYMSNSFSDCGDSILSFVHLTGRTYSVFRQFDKNKLLSYGEQDRPRLFDPVNYNHIRLPALVDALDSVMRSSLPKDTIFAIYSRGDLHLYPCGHLIKPYAAHGYAYYRSCVMDDNSIVKAVRKSAKTFGIINTSNVYLIYDVNDNDIIQKRHHPDPFRKSLKGHFTLADIIEKIRVESLVKIPYWMLPDLARVMETILASEAPFYMGNRFSNRSDLIIRTRVNLPSARLCDRL
jgi:hypothetical protein